MAIKLEAVFCHTVYFLRESATILATTTLRYLRNQ